MSSVEKLVRAALAEWIADRPWSTPPTVTADAPEPGDKPALPTLACWFDRVDVSNPSAVEVAPGVFHTGQAEAAVTFFFRCSSEDQADAFRAEWRDLVWTAAMDASPTGLAPVLPLRIDLAGESWGCKLYLEASLELAQSGETQTRSLWLVRATGRLAFPALAVREPSVLMTCSVVIDGTTFQSSAFQVPTVLETDPAASGEVAVDVPVEVTFNRPMDLDSLEAAAPGHLVTPDDELLTFAFLPESGSWALGANVLTIAETARSRRGSRLAAAFSLSFTGVSS